MSEIIQHPHNTIITNLANDDYHAHSAVSSSNCKDLLKSPWLYWHNKHNPKPPTAAMAYGSMVHHLILEPNTFDDNYLVAEIPKRVSKKGKEEYKELEQEANGRKLLALDDFLKAQEMRHNLGKNPLIRSLLSGGAAEQATFWQDELTGVECRAKADFVDFDKGIIIDLKTTSDLASEISFKWTTRKYNYHLSAAFYECGFRLATQQAYDFFFIVVESFEPFNFAIYKLGSELMRQGESLYHESLRVYRDAANKGSFELPYHGGNLVELVA